MQADDDAISYSIWGVDNLVYGPVDLPTLVNWVRDQRVLGNTWIYVRDTDSWRKAAQLQELNLFFKDRTSAVPVRTVTAKDGTSLKLKPGMLRRVKILAGLNEEQLERFVTFMELQPVRQWTEIVKQGSPGDAMYLVLEGEVRVRLFVAGKETILATLSPGEFFGEVALFDHGARSADVVANTDSLLLKISAEAFHEFIGGAPDLAATFLFGICQTLTARIRADNKRYRDSIAFARTARG
jgi:Cyclic nucleotide-binding domain